MNVIPTIPRARCRGARVPPCQGAGVPPCWGAIVPGCHRARVPSCQGARGLGAVVLAVVLSAAPAIAQQRVGNANVETHAASQGLAREIAAVSARGGVAWVGYKVPMIAGPRQMCCGDSSDGGRCLLESGGLVMNTGDGTRSDGTRVVLEAPTDFFVLARIDGEVTRVRTFTPDCDIDAGGARLVWLTGVASSSTSSIASVCPDLIFRSTSFMSASR